MAPFATCRFYDVPVPVVGSQAILRRVDGILSSSGMRILALTSAAQALQLEASAFPCLMELGLSHGPRKHTGLEDLESIALQRPSLPIIVLIDASARRTGADLIDIQSSWNVHVVEWPVAEKRLARLIVSSRFWIWTDQLSAEVSAATQVPYLVRAGLRWILRMRIPYPRLSDDATAWTLEVIANGVGCSARTLSRQARASAVDLHRIADTWVALQLLVLHEVEEVSWGQLALAVGYEGIPGLSELTLRVFDHRPRSLSGGGIELGLQQFEGLIREALRER